MPEIIRFAVENGAGAAYGFVIDGQYGSGGCPVVVGLPDPAEYRRRLEELIKMMRRSADMLQADLDRDCPPEATGKDPP